MKKNIQTNLRAIAALVLLNVLENKLSLNEALEKNLDNIADARDRAFVQAIAYGVCRWFYYLLDISKKLLKKPLKHKDQDVFILILIGLYQLLEMRLPSHAAIFETVAAVKKSWAKALVNATLRSFQRQPEKFTEKTHYSHPAWMMTKIQGDWPENWRDILIANNAHPPLSLRINTHKIPMPTYLQFFNNEIQKDVLTDESLKNGVLKDEKTNLQENKTTVCNIADTLSGISLNRPMHVKKIPGFTEGLVSVQDGAAQLAAPLLQLEAKQLVLDACAAPGGKTCHILELQPAVELVAIDVDSKRISSIQENLDRLNLKAKLITANAADPNTWWDGRLFDRILLDAPCSGSGVIRRHPDIKVLRKPEDLPKLAETQLTLLNALWPLLKSGGLLVYATCSIFVGENLDVIAKFLKVHPDAIEEKIDADWGKVCIIGRQILPGMGNMDGFYYARLRKIPSDPVK